MVVLGYELRLIFFSINLRPRQMPEYTKVGLKIACLLAKGREPLPICRDCFDSGMNPTLLCAITSFVNRMTFTKKKKELVLLQVMQKELQ
eukprot:scaffold205742_cov63-Attheya_sp.AAC.6